MADPTVATLIQVEEERQRTGLELIASENFVSPAVLAAVGSVLTNKYAEGYPGRRYYGGCEVVDEVERLAIKRAKALFGAVWANVQPHAGSQANAAVMLACLEPGDQIVGFDLTHGGHLTHGSPVNFSGKFYRAAFYGVGADGYIDWEQVVTTVCTHQPKLIICGASAYSHDWDYALLRTLADEVGALLMADIAHTAGLVACDLQNNPFPHAHIVTTTTHKTLRGPRGGMIMMGKEVQDPRGRTDRKGNILPLSAVLDKALFPGTQGGPLMHVIAGKAVAFKEAATPAYHAYIKQVKSNAVVLAYFLEALGYTIVSGSTDNHLMLVDLRKHQITGKEAEQALGKAGITVNKNTIPFDTRSPFITSGIRIGTPAVTTRGLVEGDMQQVATWIDQALTARKDEAKLRGIKQAVARYMAPYPLFQA